MSRLALLSMAAPAAMILTSCISPPGTAGRTISATAVYTGVSPPGYVPPGATVALRTTQEIRASAADKGQIFPAQLTRDLVGGNGQVLAQAGAALQLVVLDLAEGGPVARGQVQLGLARVHAGASTFVVRRDLQDLREGGPLGILLETAAAAATKGENLHVPAGAVLDFQTAEPMYLVPAGNQG